MTTRNRVFYYDMVEHYIGFTNCENSNSLIYLYKNIEKEYPEETPEEPIETMQSFNSVTAEMIRDIVRQTLKEMFSETANYSEV